MRLNRYLNCTGSICSISNTSWFNHRTHNGTSSFWRKVNSSSTSPSFFFLVFCFVAFLLNVKAFERSPSDPIVEGKVPEDVQETLLPDNKERMKFEKEYEEENHFSELETVVSQQEVFDEEEFIGFEPKRSQVKDVSLNGEGETVLVGKQPLNVLDQTTKNYYLEIFFISLIAAYVVNYFIGKRENDYLAKRWCFSAFPILESNFSKVGESAPTISVFKENPWIYTMKCTGRINCVGLQATLTLRKRHDLLSRIYEFISSSYDSVTFSILMNNECMDTFVFALVKRKGEKRFRKANKDVALFTGAAVEGPESLPSSFAVFTEAEELIPSLLFGEVLTTLKNYEDYFVKMHFSDQGILSSVWKKSIEFEFKLPPTSEMDRLHTLTKMVMFFIDWIPKISLSKKEKSKAEKLRSKISEASMKQLMQQRQEVAQQRKVEKKQKEVENLQKLSPESQRKKEEKLQRKEIKKRQSKALKLIKV